MKRLVEQDDTDGMESLIGKTITLFCLNYIYTGKLIGIDYQCVLLQTPSIVYETGAFDQPNWTDAQKLPHDIYVMLRCVEAFGVVK